ncbi:MAG: ABC transporter permease [Thermodesulfobacteria bacterium]|nr:ABC transporter permease [Thermodesulfobacteriota bacterium]
MKARRIWAVVEKEAREIRRDPLFLTMAFLVPTLFMFLFGYGLSLDVENLPFWVIDYDHSQTSRDFISHFSSSRYFSLKEALPREEAAVSALTEGKVRLVIIVPPHFERDLSRGRAAPVQVIIDGTFPYRAQVAKNYVRAVVGQINTNRLKDFFRHRGVPEARVEALAEPVRLEVRYVYNEEAKSRWSIASALIGMILLMVPPMLTSVSICREKETGSIYNIYVSTITRAEFLLGKIIPYFFIAALNTLVLYAWAILVFKTPFRGSFGFYLASALLYAFCSLGIGLFISSFTRTQIAALMISLVVALVPSFLYSGMLVPVSCLDTVGRFEAHLFPAMYFVNILHGTFLKGLGFKGLKGNFLALVLYTLVVYTLAYFSFRKRVKR